MWRSGATGRSSYSSKSLDNQAQNIVPRSLATRDVLHDDNKEELRLRTITAGADAPDVTM